jgi:putative ABC transport system permease protein
VDNAMSFTDNLIQDLRIGGRIMSRNRWQSTVIVLTLALSISALTSVVSVVNAALLKSYGPVQTDQWVYLWEHQIGNDEGRQISVSVPNFLDWKQESSRVFSAMVLWLPWSYTASGADAVNPQQIRAAVISPDMFDATGVAPALGRLLIHSDSTNNERVVVLSYEFWQRSYGGNPSLVGEKINLNLVPHTVVGVAPRGFCFPPETQTDAWTPAPAAMLSTLSRSGRGFRVAARLRPGVTPRAAQSDMTLISQTLARDYSEDRNYDTLVVPMREAVAGDFKAPLVSLSGAVAFALLLVCLNIGYLRGVHLKSRRKEMILRLALGASRVRLLRQILMETVLLFGTGGVLGLLISPIAVRVLISLVPADEIPWLQASTDFFTFLAMFVVSLLAGVVSGLIPAFTASRTEPARVLGWGGPVTNTSTLGRRLRSTSQIAQIALAFIPLCGAGLLIRSFQHLQDVAPGFDPRDRITLMFSVPKARYAGPRDIAALAARIGNETRQAPGVSQSSVAQALPFASGTRWLQAVTRSDPKVIAHLSQLPLVRYTVVTRGYFEAMGIPLKAGRTLTEGDDMTAQPVVVINEQLARAQFGGEDPLGKQLWIGHAEGLPGSRPRVIVGVVADTRMDALESAPDPAAWVPISQQNDSESVFRNLYLVAHTSIGPSFALGGIQERIRSIDPDLALSDVASMEDRLAGSLWRQRFSAIVVGAVGIAALAIAVLGVFGMTSYLVASRTFEIGVRMAIGATRLDILTMILGQSIAMALVGAVFGLLGGIGATRVLAKFLFGVTATDPLTLGGVALLLVASASAASYIPVRRAASVDPIIALRVE